MLGNAVPGSDPCIYSSGFTTATEMHLKRAQIIQVFSLTTFGRLAGLVQ